MLAKKKTSTNLGVGVGLVLQLVGFGLFMLMDPELFGPALLLLLLSEIPFGWGCVCYAQGKGYPGVLGLVGLTGLFGLFIMVLLPDQTRNRPEFGAPCAR